MATYKELMAQKAALEAHLEEVRSNEVASVIEKIQNLMAEYGLTVEDIAKRRRGRPAGSGAARRNRRCPRSTWTRRLARPGLVAAANRPGLARTPTDT